MIAFLLACQAEPSPKNQTPLSIPQSRPSERGDERVIVAFGDSLTAGYGVAPKEAYPALLEGEIRRAGYRYKVVNAGVSGETTAGGVERLSVILEMSPEIIILALGTNDALRGLPLTHTKENLTKIIEAFQDKKIKVVLAGMKIPSNYGPRYSQTFQDIYPALQNRYGLTLIPFLLEGVAMHPDLNLDDGMHPNGAGYSVVVTRIWPVIRPLLIK